MNVAEESGGGCLHQGGSVQKYYLGHDLIHSNSKSPLKPKEIQLVVWQQWCICSVFSFHCGQLVGSLCSLILKSAGQSICPILEPRRISSKCLVYLTRISSMDHVLSQIRRTSTKQRWESRIALPCTHVNGGDSDRLKRLMTLKRLHETDATRFFMNQIPKAMKTHFAMSSDLRLNIVLEILLLFLLLYFNGASLRKIILIFSLYLT